jgi:hypothetical protein
MHREGRGPDIERAVTAKAQRFMSHLDVCPQHCAGEVERLQRELDIAKFNLKYAEWLQNEKRAHSEKKLRLVPGGGEDS